MLTGADTDSTNRISYTGYADGKPVRVSCNSSAVGIKVARPGSRPLADDEKLLTSIHNYVHERNPQSDHELQEIIHLFVSKKYEGSTKSLEQWRDEIITELFKQGIVIEVTLPGQGGYDHRYLQSKLGELGELRRFHVRTDYSIGARLKPDVLWFKDSPEHGGGAVLIVEIERGGSSAIQKSLSSLRYANNRWPGAQLRLIVPASRKSAIEEEYLSAFREIQKNLKITSLEDCLTKDHYYLAKKLMLLDT